MTVTDSLTAPAANRDPAHRDPGDVCRLRSLIFGAERERARLLTLPADQAGSIRLHRLIQASARIRALKARSPPAAVPPAQPLVRATIDTSCPDATIREWRSQAMPRQLPSGNAASPTINSCERWDA